MFRKCITCLVVLTAFVTLTSSSAFAVMSLHKDTGNDRGHTPPNGTQWHEIYPTFCTQFTQQDYEDNGNGIVDSCDYIVLTNAAGGNWRYHIQEVLWTYVVTGPTNRVYYYFESEYGPADNPVGDQWHQVYPTFCETWNVESWKDEGVAGEIDVCDLLAMRNELGGLVEFHVTDVNIDIIVGDGTPAKRGTWGKIKGFFGSIF